MALTRSATSCSTAFRTSRPSRTSVVCHATLHNAQQPVVSRRAANLAASAWAVALFAGSQPARALIPDEEDEALLERAKANRQKKLQQQKETTREFLKDEGLKNGKLDQDLVPVQKAVVQLAKSGSQLESGDLKGAASTLSSGWVDEFEKASKQLSASEASQASADQIFSSISSLKSSASSGDVKGSKRQFVALVAAVKEWADATGVAANLKGL